jgi:transposase InsO family protein
LTHRNARLTPAGRLLLCRRIDAGAPIAHVAAAMGISRQCASKWWHRWCEFGEAGLEDRSCAPRRRATIAPQVERRIVQLRRSRRWGPDRIAGHLDQSRSTVHRVLVRHGVNRLDHFDRQTRRPIRRYEHRYPGSLVHVDVKKLGRIPRGGGWRAHGRSEAVRGRGIGYAFIHAAVDDHSRLAYLEVLDDEKGPTCAAFWARADAWFRAHGIVTERVMTDNAKAYLGFHFQRALTETGARHVRIPIRRPQVNGKVERFNRTLLDECAYATVYRSDHARTRALARWLHIYNHHRPHTALNGKPPITRVTNPAGDYS